MMTDEIGRTFDDDGYQILPPPRIALPNGDGILLSQNVDAQVATAKHNARFDQLYTATYGPRRVYREPPDATR